METRFNVFEILEIAEQIEHKTAKFYLKAAEVFADADRRDLLYRLATWKAKHEQIWARMRKRFSDKTGEFGTFDPDNYVLSNPEVMSGLAGSSTQFGAIEQFTGKEDRRQILKDAIRRFQRGGHLLRRPEGFCPRPGQRGHPRHDHPRGAPAGSVPFG